MGFYPHLSRFRIDGIPRPPRRGIPSSRIETRPGTPDVASIEPAISRLSPTRNPNAPIRRSAGNRKADCLGADERSEAPVSGYAVDGPHRRSARRR